MVIRITEKKLEQILNGFLNTKKLSSKDIEKLISKIKESTPKPCKHETSCEYIALVYECEKCGELIKAVLKKNKYNEKEYR